MNAFDVIKKSFINSEFERLENSLISHYLAHEVGHYDIWRNRHFDCFHSHRTEIAHHYKKIAKN
jgi:hypothetical protein